MNQLVIVGAALSGLRAAQGARDAGYTGAIVLVGDEDHLPYDRPPLSKEFLSPDAQPEHYLTRQEIEDLGITLRLGTHATALDPDHKEVVLGDERLPYDRLVVATGAVPRRIPGFPDLDGVITLRTLDDAIDLRSRIKPGVRVVVIGAGFIGSEIASSAHERGADVTIAEGAPIPLVRAVGDEIGKAISSLHERNGVRLICEAKVDGLEGEAGRVTGVKLGSGEVLPADLVVVGIGAAPATDWLESSGIARHERDGGLLCDEYLETSIPDVYACGDIVHWPNGLLDITMRLENWTNAGNQGTRAGANAVVERADRKPYETVPYVWSDWYGQRIQMVGTADSESVDFVQGGPDDDSFIAFYRTGDRLVGAVMLNEPRRVSKLRKVIAKRGTIDDAMKVVNR